MSAVYPLEELPRFLGRCDYLVSVLPSTPGTRGLLDGDVLAACAPRRPALINVGRGDLVSEAAVLGALDRGWLSHPNPNPNPNPHPNPNPNPNPNSNPNPNPNPAPRTSTRVPPAAVPPEGSSPRTWLGMR